MRIGIVGGGISGVSLASSLLSFFSKVEIVFWDFSLPGEASAIAPGLFNVVTGKRPVLTPSAVELHQNLMQWIQTLPTWKKWVHFLPIYRPFQSPFELNEWSRRIQSEKSYQHFCEIDTRGPHFLKNEYGYLVVKKCGYIKIESFLNDYKALLKQKGVWLVQERFDHTRFHIGGKKSWYDQVGFDYMLFCEGYHTLQNPYWVRTGPRPLKGETLLLAFPEPIPLRGILVKNGYFLPYRNGTQMLVGATHEYRFSSPNPSEEGKNQLLQKFISIFPNQSFHVVDHKSGVRLTTPNRRPIMGLESYWDNRIGFFCGLGTKGLLYAPTCAKLFSHFLLDHQEIPAEFQLERFPLIKRN